MRWPWAKEEFEEHEGVEVTEDADERAEARRKAKELLHRAVDLGIEADNLLRRF